MDDLDLLMAHLAARSAQGPGSPLPPLLPEYRPAYSHTGDPDPLDNLMAQLQTLPGSQRQRPTQQLDVATAVLVRPEGAVGAALTGELARLLPSGEASR